MQNFLYWVAREKFVKKEKAEESDFSGSEESDSHDLEVERASSQSSRSERGTVEDFLGFSYQEFPDLIQAETVNDFLESLADVAPLDETVKEVPEERPYKCDIHRIPTGPCREYKETDEVVIPTTYTIDDIVQTEAMTRLRDMLYSNYSSEMVQLFEKTPIHDDEVEEPVESEAQRTSKKDRKKNEDEKAEEGGDSEGSGDERKKKKKKKDK